MWDAPVLSKFLDFKKAMVVDWMVHLKIIFIICGVYKTFYCTYLANFNGFYECTGYVCENIVDPNEFVVKV